MTQVFDVNSLNAFLEGTENVLKTMCQTTPVSGKPHLRKDSSCKGDISGTISLTSQDQRGSVTLAFSKDAALFIVSRMLSEEKTWLDKEVKDAVGELTNMIAGDSRKNLSAHGMKFEAGIPMVIIGPDHEIYTEVSGTAPVISIPFSVDEEHPFSIDFSFEIIPKTKK